MNWKKVSLLTILGMLITLMIIGTLLDLRISKPSSNIDFPPGQPTSKVSTGQTVENPENIILFLVDGMGFGHLSLALLTQQSENSSSVWQEFQIKGWHDARSVYGPLTDSETSATAMATGNSTNFGHIGMDQEGKPIQTLMELASEEGNATGIVTDSYIWDGTPAAFIAHTTNEDDARDILTQISNSQLDLIFGELEDLGEDDIPEKEESLEILKKRFQLLDHSLNLSSSSKGSSPVAAIFEEDEIQDIESSPNLKRMTEVALEYMTAQERPFVLLVESEEMDAASHENDSDRVLRGLAAIQEALAVVLAYAKKQGNTLVLFTADHETGGLTAQSDYDHYPQMQIRWSTKEHTASVVPLFADGPGAKYFANVHRNREIGSLMKELILLEVPNSKLDEEKK